MKTAALVLLAAFAPGLVAGDDVPSPGTPGSALHDTIATLDHEVFAAYNRCDLETFERFFAPDVEFYHDTGGVTWTRQDVVDGTRKYICGKVRRELVDGTLRVHPIKGYGALEEGEHRFCPLDGGACQGIAKFVMVWREGGEAGDGWRMTRILSYGHRAADPVDAAAD